MFTIKPDGTAQREADLSVSLQNSHRLYLREYEYNSAI